MQPLSTQPSRSEARVLPSQTSNIINIEMRPFDPATFEREGESYVDETTGEVKVRLKDANTIRWRIVTDEHGAVQPRFSQTLCLSEA